MHFYLLLSVCFSPLSLFVLRSGDESGIPTFVTRHDFEIGPTPLFAFSDSLRLDWEAGSERLEATRGGHFSNQHQQQPPERCRRRLCGSLTLHFLNSTAREEREGQWPDYPR